MGSCSLSSPHTPKIDQKRGRVETSRSDTGQIPAASACSTVAEASTRERAWRVRLEHESAAGTHACFSEPSTVL